MNKIARILEVNPMRVFEVATFYTMFNQQKIGTHHIQVCTTTPCMICGAYDILKTVSDHLGIKPGGTSQQHCPSAMRAPTPRAARRDVF